MNLLPTVLAIDEWIFIAVNTFFHSELLDSFFLFFSFYPLLIWLLIGLIVVIVEERRDHTFFIKLVLALGFAGFMASVFFKPIFARPRPDISHGAKVVIISEKAAAVPFNNDFAFPSGHAAVAFAGAYIVTREETQKKHKTHTAKYRKIAPWFFYVFASVTAFSRIYLGKHYPLDVISGALLGVLMGEIIWIVVERGKMFFLKNLSFIRNI